MKNAIQTQPETAIQEAQRFDAFLPDWHAWLDLRVRAGEISANTAAAYKRGMAKFASFADTADVDAIREWKAEMLETCKPRSVSAWLAGVKSFFAWAMDTYHLPYNPAANIKGGSRKGQTRRHVRDALTDVEVRRVLAMPDNTRDAAILALMAYTGIRTVEVHRADLDDLRTKAGQHRLYVQGKGHAESDDFVVLNDEATAPMLAWLAERGPAPGALFTSQSKRSKGARLSLQAIRALVMHYFRLAGVTGNKTTHSLRHTALNHAIQAAAELGKPITSVMSMSRHASVDTLMIYAHDIERDTDPIETHIKY